MQKEASRWQRKMHVLILELNICAQTAKGAVAATQLHMYLCMYVCMCLAVSHFSAFSTVKYVRKWLRKVQSIKYIDPLLMVDR